jgi:hypothetical protein
MGGAVSTGTAPVKVPKGFRLKLQQMLAGVEAAIPDGTSVTVPGGSMAKAAIVQKLTAATSEFQTVDASLTALDVARTRLRGDLPDLHAFYDELKTSLSASFGKGNPLLAQFGLSPQKPRKKLTPEQRVARAAKARATRQLRHTGGVRQKAAVQYQGQVDVSHLLRPQPASQSTGEAPSVDVSPGVTTSDKPAETPPAHAG